MARRGLMAGATVLALVLSASGCAWRVDGGPAPFRTPSALTVLRDRLAAAEDAVGDVAATSAGPLADAEAQAVPSRLAALGGVSPTSAARPSNDLDAAIDAATREALACMDVDDPLGALCAAIALSHTAMREAADPLTASAPGYAPQTSLPAATTAMSADALAQLARRHDELRALEEVVAARSEGDVRAVALARAAAQSDRVRALLAIDGVADLTSPAYDVPTDAGAELAAATSVAQAYAGLLAAAQPQDRAWLLDSAVAAYADAVRAGLSLGEVPALPGVAVN